MAHADSPCFPVEIFDLIVDSVQDLEGWQPRLSSLCACSLVSRRFALRARRHIFREATLYAWDDSSNVKMFHEILTWVPSDPETGCSFPPVKSFIKDFSIDYSPSNSEASMLLERVVIAILQVLGGQEGGLESFAFEYEGIWLDLDLGLRQAVWDILQSPHLESLGLKFMLIPNTFLLGCTVHHLFLDNIQSEDMSDSMDQLTPSQSPRSEDAQINHKLESLKIDRPDTNHVVLLLGSTDSSAQAKLPRLQSLTATLYFFEEEYNMIAPFLSQAEETLEYFKITYGDQINHPVPPPPMVDLGTMKRLKHLELDSHELDVGTVLRDYTLLLDVLTAPASLETLDLHFALSLYNKDHYTALAPLFQSLGAPSDSNVWTALNDILSAPFRFVGLRRLAIHVHLLHYPVPRPIPDARFRDLITTLIFFALPYFSGADGVRELVVDFTT